MHKVLEKRLVKKYPNIFKEYGGDITKTCMGWGMTCGKGWFLLIDELCSKLSESAVAQQVKEKLGGLRFYLQGTEEDHKIEAEYESKSLITCEHCGGPGERKSDHGWLRTTCDHCDEIRKLSTKIREGHYVYAFDDTAHIIVSDPIEDPECDNPIFSGTIYEFMKLMAPTLNLLEDPMSTDEKPLWEQI